ncbi:leukocyte-associated immunoglobulin-like receptor 1 [Tiliqua scincoides]|uniref:leukocyte-associated immunoglobulin-like receptor 1 n=1 Tax=Tiliqua scincoides TaxID=71010 RepID=UPI003461AC7E
MEFHLQKQTSSDFEMWRTEVAERDEVVFPFDNVAPSDAGIYRCIYCYKTYSCQAWSRYSERVNISIRGQIHPKSSTPVNAREKSYNDDFPVNSSTIIWAGAAAGSLVLILLLLLLAFVLYRKRKRGSTAHERTQPLPMKETNLPLKPESEGEAEDDPDGVSYAVLNHHSLKRQEAAKLESISESCVYASVANGRSRKGL